MKIFHKIHHRSQIIGRFNEKIDAKPLRATQPDA
jgi:hypothetical protein